MWNDDTYQNEYGKCAYVAGTVSVLTGDLGTALYHAGVKNEALESDVFCIETCDEDVIRSCVRERAEKFLIQESDEPQAIELLDAEIKKLMIGESNKSMQSAISELYKDKSDVDKERADEAIENYCTHIKYYLGKPQAVYSVARDSVEMLGKLANVYLYMLFDIIFVEFESHLLMFMRGSVE